MIERSWLRDRRGQSFVEAMVAITIIVSSISSALALVQSSITATRIGGTHVVAANLAREGLEVVRSMRDTNWLKSRSFQVGLIDAGGDKIARSLLDVTSGDWSLSFAATSLTDANAAVYLADGIYVQADAPPSRGTKTLYSRTLTLLPICRDNGAGVERAVSGTDVCLVSETLVGLLVDSSVRWQTVSGQYQTLTAEERLYDWR